MTPGDVSSNSSQEKQRYYFHVSMSILPCSCFSFKTGCTAPPHATKPADVGVHNNDRYQKKCCYGNSRPEQRPRWHRHWLTFTVQPAAADSSWTSSQHVSVSQLVFPHETVTLSSWGNATKQKYYSGPNTCKILPGWLHFIISFPKQKKIKAEKQVCVSRKDNIHDW